jgi:hypothetical protein
MFEIRISPETPTEFKAVVRMLQELADAQAEPGQTGGGVKASSAQLPEPPASTAEDAADVQDIVSIEFSPASGEPDPTYSAQQVLEALQGYARENGAAALKKVLDRFGARRVSEIKPEHYREVMTIARGEEN